MSVVERGFDFNRKKAKEIVQYIVYLTEKTPSHFGKTKLHKKLWFYEGFTMLAKGKRAIGGRFVKNRYGPTLEELDDVIEELEKEGLLKIEKVVQPGFFSLYSQWMFKASPPKLKHLSKEEIELISFLVYKFGNVKAKDPSKYTHTPAFKIKKEYEELSPLMILHHFVREPTEEEVRSMEKFIQLTERGEHEKIVDEIKKELSLQ